MGSLNNTAPTVPESLTWQAVDRWDPRGYVPQAAIDRLRVDAAEAPDECFWRLHEQREERLAVQDELDELRTLLADVRRGIRTLDELPI